MHVDAPGQVNPAKEKKLSNVRSVSAEDKIVLTPPRTLSLEDAIGCVLRCMQIHTCMQYG